MIRALAPLALLAAACSGPTAPVPTGFGGVGSCAPGARISGESEMGVGKTRPDGGTSVITDVDAKIIMSNRIGAGCFGASYDAEGR